jgi:hypothetical protein
MKLKNGSLRIVLVSAALLISVFAYPQKGESAKATIKASDLESHLSFLAYPLLKGRANGSAELEIAARYIASQAQKTGLKPVNGGSYFYPYTITRKSIDQANSSIVITPSSGQPSVIKEDICQLMPMGGDDFEIEGEVVFAGYGIKADKFRYDDFDTLNVTGKILLLMNRAPMTSDGKSAFGDQNWFGMNGLQSKLMTIRFKRPKAVMIVCDPKSEGQSAEEMYPEINDYLQSAMALKGQVKQAIDFSGFPKVLFVHRKVADQILYGTGKTLAGLQEDIDNTLKSHSFAIPGKTVRIKEVTKTEDIEMPNVAGIVEGSDPVLRNEVVIFSGHMDHIGGEGDKIHPGADDNASGCSALLELAEAFQLSPVKPARSVMFLWVSGEEVGLFGSESYVSNPVFPLGKTVADLNMDMIGRVKGVADTTSDTPMTGPGAVFVITCNQSRELVSIADAMAKKNNLLLDYSLSGRNHPLMLFARSDHFNFVKKDIPVLFFTTGLHTDYHKYGDIIEKIDFKKMESITKTIFDIGYEVANRKIRIIVDNPYSNWNKNIGVR